MSDVRGGGTMGVEPPDGSRMEWTLHMAADGCGTIFLDDHGGLR